jgi:succinyl-diaminopimelate desuccinylase
MKKSNTISQILDLSKKLIAVPSVQGNTEGMKKVLDIANHELGTNFPIETFEQNGISSLLARNTLKRPKRFRVILNAHLDVVPGEEKIFKPKVKDGRLYGRGSYDMKAAAAAMILLFKDIEDKVDYPLGLQLTTDEEIGGIDGTKHQVESGVRADFVITGEGTNLRAIHQSKGMLRIKLTASGRASHSAYPWLGENAILNLHSAINAILSKFPSPKEETHTTTITVTHIATRSSSEHTVTPDHCEALLDVRYASLDRHTILSTIKSLLPQNIELEVLHSSHVHNTDANNAYIKVLETASHKTMQERMVLANAHGTSDARHFAEVGCEGVEFGPVGGGHHHEGEWVDIISLEKYYRILENFLTGIKK